MLNPARAMRSVLAMVLAATTSSVHAQETGVLPPFITSSIAVVVKEKCCDWQSQHVPVPDSADREALEKLRDRAYRNGIILQLKLDNDRSLKLIDETNLGNTCDGYDGCRKHRLTGYWPKQRQYIVEVDLWEGGNTYLVSARDGRLLRVGSPPILSPSGEYAIAIDNSIAYPNGGLELIDLRKDPPTGMRLPDLSSRPWTKPQLWLRPNPRWLDDTRIIFEGSLDPVQFDPDVKHILRIVDGKPEWEC
jgi:hypothetical protein